MIDLNGQGIVSEVDTQASLKTKIRYQRLQIRIIHQRGMMTVNVIIHWTEALLNELVMFNSLLPNTIVSSDMKDRWSS